MRRKNVNLYSDRDINIKMLNLRTYAKSKTCAFLSTAGRKNWKMVWVPCYRWRQDPPSLSLFLTLQLRVRTRALNYSNAHISITFSWISSWFFVYFFLQDKHLLTVLSLYVEMLRYGFMHLCTIVHTMHQYSCRSSCVTYYRYGFYDIHTYICLFKY